MLNIFQSDFQSDDEWTLTRQGKFSQVNFVQTGTQFAGHDLDLDNPSTFSGEVLTGLGRTLVHFVQIASNKYYAVYAGHLVDSGCIEGHYYDTMGNAGEFSLKYQLNLSKATENARERAISSRRLNNPNHPNFHDSNDPPPPTAGVYPVTRSNLRC